MHFWPPEPARPPEQGRDGEDDVRELMALSRDIEAVVAAGDFAKQHVILEQITQLFVTKGRRLPADQEELFDGLFLALTRAAGGDVRHRVAEALCTFRKAPRGIVALLAADAAAEVAAPLLEHSPKVPEDLLVRVARTMGDEHLLPLSRRAALTPAVADPIAARGGDPVVLSLARNDGAALSDGGFATLAARAQPSEPIHAAACLRPDLPDAHFTKLLALGFTRACDALDDEFGDPALPGRAIVADIARTLADSSLERVKRHNIKTSILFVDAQVTARELTEADIGRWLSRRLIEDAVVGLAYLSRLPTRYVVRLCCAPTLIPATLFIKALGFSWPTAKALLRLMGSDGDKLDELRRGFALFDAISPETARRTIRHAAMAQKVVAFPLWTD